MPGISDPGTHLVQAAIDSGHAVVPLPGPSALTAAVAASGLPTRRFHYLGFLPRRGGQRRKLLKEAARLPETLVAFEAPHRVRATLADLREALGERRIAVCRELTKLYEEIYRGTLSDALDRFTEPRGEFTLVIEGAGEGAADRPATEDIATGEIDKELRALRAEGLRAREAVREVARRRDVPHREVYKRWLTLTQADEPDSPVS